MSYIAPSPLPFSPFSLFLLFFSVTSRLLNLYSKIKCVLFLIFPILFSICDLLIIGKAKKSSSSKKSNTSKKGYDPLDATRKLAEAKALVAARLIEMDNETSSSEEEEDSSDDSDSDSERRDTGSNKKGKRYNTRPFNVHPCYTSHSSSSFFFL